MGVGNDSRRVFPSAQQVIRALTDFWFVLGAGLLFLAPVLVRLARDVWSLEQGAQGPIILVSGIWLLIGEARGLPVGAGKLRPALLMLAPMLVLAVLSRMLGMLWLQWLSGYGALVIVGYGYIGGEAIRRLWFPLAYLLFLMPPPHAASAAMTDWLKIRISVGAVNLLSWAGYDVARSGTMLYIDQYELLMADACAGMNSLFSLLAIGLFYIYVRWRTNWRYSLLLALFVFPIAVLANLIRVIAVMLGTRWFGDGFTQAVIHPAAGFIMFAVALACLMGLDAALAALRRPMRAA